MTQTQKTTRIRQDKLASDIRRMRAAGRDLELCEFIEQLLRLDALDCRVDERDGRPIHLWTVRRLARDAVILPPAGEIVEAFMDLAMDGEIAFSTDIDLVTLNIHFVVNKSSARVC